MTCVCHGAIRRHLVGATIKCGVGAERLPEESRSFTCVKIWRAPGEKILSAIRSRKTPKLDAAAAVDVPIMIEILASQRTADIGAFADVLVNGGEQIGLQVRALTPSEVAALTEQLARVAIEDVAELLATTDLSQTIFSGKPVPAVDDIVSHLVAVADQVAAAASTGQGLLVDLRG